MNASPSDNEYGLTQMETPSPSRNEGEEDSVLSVVSLTWLNQQAMRKQEQEDLLLRKKWKTYR